MAFWVTTTDGDLVNIETGASIGIGENKKEGNPVGASIYCFHGGGESVQATPLATIPNAEGGMAEARRRLRDLKNSILHGNLCIFDLNQPSKEDHLDSPITGGNQAPSGPRAR